MLQAEIPKPRGFAMQVRINMESMRADGSAKPAGGTITAFEAPSGPRVRTDSFAYAGYTTSPNFDSLLAKLIVHSHSADFADLVTREHIARFLNSESRACRPTLDFCKACCSIRSSSRIAYTRASSRTISRRW